MANWPTVDELKSRLDIESSDWDDQLARVLSASIGEIKARRGNWDESLDLPDEALSQAALERAVEFGTNGEIPALTAAKSERYLYGKRTRWGTA